MVLWGQSVFVRSMRKWVGHVGVSGPNPVEIVDSGGELWMLRSLWSPFKQVCISCELWYSPNVKGAI